MANITDKTVFVIDTETNTVVNTIARGGFEPLRLAADPTHERIYVFSNTGAISYIDTDTNTVLDTIAQVGSGPNAIAFDPTHQRMYVVNTDGISVIDTDTNTVLEAIQLGMIPQGIALHPTHGRMYVSNQPYDTVSIIDIDTNTVIGSPLTVGDFPDGIALILHIRECMSAIVMMVQYLSLIPKPTL